VYPCGEHHLIGLELVERRDTLVLAQLGAGLGGAGRQPAHPASRLKRPIRGMEDRAVEPIAERVRKLVAPLGLEAVLAESLVLGLELGALVPIGSQTEAARPPEGVARQPFEPVEVALGQAPERFGSFRAEVATGNVVGRRSPAEREAAVSPARSAGDLARLVETDTPPRLGQCKRARAARYAAAHDRHVHRPRRPLRRLGKARPLFGEPVGVDHDVSDPSPAVSPACTARRPPQPLPRARARPAPLRPRALRARFPERAGPPRRAPWRAQSAQPSRAR
jgi:hypothetical protein